MNSDITTKYSMIVQEFKAKGKVVLFFGYNTALMSNNDFSLLKSSP